MSKPRSLQNDMARHGIKVQVHSSPSSVQLVPPTSPDMIPAFAVRDSGDAAKVGTSLKRDRKTAFQSKSIISLSKEKLKKNQDEMKKKSSNIRNPKQETENISIPLNIGKPKNRKDLKSSTLTNLGTEIKKPTRKALTSRDQTEEKDVNDLFKRFLDSDFPPYNPEDFTPKDDSISEGELGNSELLQNIRLELDEWLNKCPEKKGSCPEMWSSVPSTCRVESRLMGDDASKRKPAKKHVPSKENVGIQATPQTSINQASSMNLATLSFLDNPKSMLIKGPKTPPPLPKTKILEAADHLLAAAERELNLVEAKISSDRLLSAKTSSLHANELSSARRAMADLPLSPTKGIVCSHSLLNNRSKTSYCVPPNSLSSFKVNGGEDNYKRNNGEKKSLNNKHSSKPKESKPSKGKGEENLSQVEPRDTCNPSAIAGFSMFYEQQQLVEKKTQGFKEKNLATVIFKSDAKVVSSTAVVRQDAQTNTSPVSQNVQSNTFAQNSSIISMKTNKPEEEDLPKMFSGKALNVQKMPSVNIRPGFTIQHGPKINIVGTSTSSLKPKRKNTEFFDVVYPPSSPLFSDSSFLSEQGRPNKQMDNNVEYICERHTFPSGRLIPGTMGENLRQSHLRNSLNLNEKKEIVIDLIKSVTEKVEKQSSLGYKNCCRLVCSLPLLACVVRKIQVDCVKCVDLLNNHLNRLEVLMKEELRGNREMSDEHCCQLDEAIHYQIVELELMEEENLKSQPPAPVTVVRHRDGIHS